MKKLATLLAALALVCVCTIPVSAATKQDNEHQIADILGIPETAVEKSVPKPQHLQDKKMMEIVEASEGVIPEDYEINHLTMIRQRDITNDGASIPMSVRAWGGQNRYLVVFFKAEGEEEWTVLAAAKGEYIDFTIPGDGQYALAWSW